MKLYLIRHAQTKQERQQESNQWHLSEQGCQQAGALAQESFWSHVDLIVVSSEPKTRLTIEPVVAAWGIPVVEDARFDEVYRGGWINDYAAQVRRFFATPEQSAEPWESAADALDRFLGGLASLQEAYGNQTLALVGHGLILSLYRAYLLGQPAVHFADWQRLAFAAVALVNPTKRLLLKDFTPLPSVR